MHAGPLKNAGLFALASASAVALAGCATGGADADLRQATSAFSSRNYQQAIASADAALAHNPTGATRAEVLYVRGRAIEDQPAPSQAEADTNLQLARTQYVTALDARPGRALEGLIRASLADVAYWQGDYQTAAEQWQTAAGMTRDTDVAAWSLYLAGTSRQRLGQWPLADAIFVELGKRYPAAEPARRGREKQGLREFNVQVGTFANPQLAARVAGDLRRKSLPVKTRINPANQTVVLVGPYPTYAAATEARAGVQGVYADALIVP